MHWINDNFLPPKHVPYLVVWLCCRLHQISLNLISPKRFKIQSFQVVCYPSKKYPTIPFISGDHGFAIGMLMKLRFHLRKLGTYSGSPCSSLVPFKGRPEFFPRSPNHGQFRSIGTHCLSNEAISESGFCRYFIFPYILCSKMNCVKGNLLWTWRNR